MRWSDVDAVNRAVVRCRACPRLVAWREEVAATKRAAYAEETYWGRPVPAFGDPQARVVIVGLAPAAHGANRTGRMFTGDRSGDFLFASLHRTGFANQPNSDHLEDGLRLTDAWVTAPVRCAPPANDPTTAERDACAPYLTRELELLPWRVIVALGGFGWDGVLRFTGWEGRKPRFGHGAEAPLPDGRVLLGSYHVSQQNTFTGRLTEGMLDAVFLRARELAAGAA
ncbi:uracil-DNA glycosylase [Nitriliruptoraceae bacterium ZYF776]|nr:uracil-DNA glycosylase [Profundirhabdus halotolerans]